MYNIVIGISTVAITQYERHSVKMKSVKNFTYNKKIEKFLLFKDVLNHEVQNLTYCLNKDNLITLKLIFLHIDKVKNYLDTLKLDNSCTITVVLGDYKPIDKFQGFTLLEAADHKLINLCDYCIDDLVFSIREDEITLYYSGVLNSQKKIRYKKREIFYE